MLSRNSFLAIEQKVDRYRAKLIAKADAAKMDESSIRKEIESVFASYGDVTINLPALVTICLQKQKDITPENWKQRADVINEFIHDQAQDESWIQIRKGKSGGVRLINTHIMQGVMGATCKSVIVKRPTHSRKTKTLKRSNKR